MMDGLLMDTTQRGLSGKKSTTLVKARPFLDLEVIRLFLPV
jgi:hypothetical protein